MFSQQQHRDYKQRLQAVCDKVASDTKRYNTEYVRYGVAWSLLRSLDRGKRERVDVLVLSRYPLAKAQKELIQDLSHGELHVASWALYCASGSSVNREVRVPFDSMQKAQDMRTASDASLPWGTYFMSALRAFRPKRVIILCYGNRDSDFKPHWPKYATGVPNYDRDAALLPHPKADQAAFMMAWQRDVTDFFRLNHFVGAKRTASGAIDAFEAMRESQQQRANAAKAARKAKEADAPSAASAEQQFTVADFAAAAAAASEYAFGKNFMTPVAQDKPKVCAADNFASESPVTMEKLPVTAGDGGEDGETSEDTAPPMTPPPLSEKVSDGKQTAEEFWCD